MPPIVPFKKNTVVVCTGKPATAPILLFTIDEVRKIDDSYVYSLAAYKHPYNKDCWIPHSALAEVPEVPAEAPLYTIINAVVKHRDALTRATNELAELRRRLSWTLNSKNDDASIFTKIDHIKNLAFNPAKYRIGDEVVVKSGTGATLTRIKEVVPLDNGFYHYQLEMKIAEKYAVVEEENIRLFAQRA